MNTIERGDALLTAYVNKDFERVKALWSESARLDIQATAVALHGYKNPSITDTYVGMAVVYSVISMRDYEAEGRKQNEINAAKRKLHSLGYNEYFCEVTGISYWSQTENGVRISDGLYDSYGTSDPRKVLESLKK